MSDPKLPTGSNCEADWSQKTHRKVHGAPGRIRNTSTIQADYRHDGIYLHAKPPKGGSSPAQPPQIKRLHFLQMFVDYFMTKEGIAVAKPWRLRASRTSETALDGNTWAMSYFAVQGNGLIYQSRKKSFQNYFEYQRITPGYMVADEIVAEQADTGLSYIDDNGNPQTVQWIELLPQRMWARRIDQSTW